MNSRKSIKPMMTFPNHDGRIAGLEDFMRAQKRVNAMLKRVISILQGEQPIEQHGELRIPNIGKLLDNSERVPSVATLKEATEESHPLSD